jgi:hypothetical protein
MHGTRRSIAMLMVAIAASAAPAQEPAVPVVPSHGVEIFCHLLHHLKFEPIGDITDLAGADPDDTLIVIFGDLGLVEQARSTKNPNGFAWLIATDRPTSVVRAFNTELRPWKLSIPFAEVTQNKGAYRGLPRCPLLKKSLDSDHPVLLGIEKGIATNGPSYLQSDGTNLLRLATFDPGSVATNRRRLDRPDVGYIFGTHGQSRERVLILAGQGMFINGMLAQADNDNVLFTLSALSWLKQAKRTRALVINNGTAVTKFDLPLTGMPPLPIPPVAVINQMLRDLEEEGIPRRLLEEMVGPTNLLRIALIVGTFGILFYGAHRLWGTRHRQENVPLLFGQVTPPPGPRPVMEQRQRELILQDNLWEPAQALARQWFVDHAGVDAPLWDLAAAATPPPFQTAAGFVARRTLLRQVHELWDYATRDPSRRVSVREFTGLVEMQRTLTEAVQTGRLQLDAPGR